MAEFTVDEVAKHNTESNIWIIIHGKVYDTTKYLDLHPGGKYVMLEVAGKDATADFDYVGHSQEALDKIAEFEVGTLAGYKPKPKRVARPLVSDSVTTLTATANSAEFRFDSIFKAGGLVALAVGGVISSWPVLGYIGIRNTFSGLLIAVIIAGLSGLVVFNRLRREIFHLKGVFEYEPYRQVSNWQDHVVYRERH